MFEQIKTLMLAKGETLQGDDPSQIDHYGYLINESLSAMNNAWSDAQVADEGKDQQKKLDTLSEEIGKVLCAVAAFGYSFGFPVEASVERVIQEGEALRSPMFDDCTERRG